MAHELEFQQGVASTFSVGETPWHREGIILAEAPSYAEAIKLARLDYPVEKVGLFRQVGDPTQQEYVESTVGFATVRTDTGKELGSVGKDYSVVQNKDAFAILEPLVNDGVATLETGGVLRDGADAWLLMRWNLAKFGPIVREVFADEVIPFGLVSTNHSGRRGVLVKDTPIRVVCANTLGAAEGEGGHAITVRHTGDANVRLVEAAQSMWGAMIERMETTARAYRTLKARYLDEEMFKTLVVDAIATDPRKRSEFNPEAKLAEMVVERYERKVTRVTELWTSGKGHTGDHSAWEAYNGAVELLDHDRDLFPTRAGAFRTASLLDGDLGKRKAAVLANLLGAA